MLSVMKTTPADFRTTPKPDLINAMIGSVMAAQGFVQIDEGKSQPWRQAERMAEFERCAPWVAASLKGNSLTLEEIREGVRCGWFYPFFASDGVMITELILSPRLRALHVLVAGGSLRAIRDLTPKAETFARMAGCNFTGASGRRGWVRWLRPFGYAPSSLVTVEKAL